MGTLRPRVAAMAALLMLAASGCTESQDNSSHLSGPPPGSILLEDSARGRAAIMRGSLGLGRTVSITSVPTRQASAIAGVDANSAVRLVDREFAGCRQGQGLLACPLVMQFGSKETAQRVARRIGDQTSQAWQNFVLVLPPSSPPRLARGYSSAFTAALA